MDKNLFDMLEEVQYKIISLNIIKDKRAIMSKTIIFFRTGEEIVENNNNYIQLSNGKGDILYIHNEELKNYKLVEIKDNFHYVFQYDI